MRRRESIQPHIRQVLYDNYEDQISPRLNFMLHQNMFHVLNQSIYWELQKKVTNLIADWH